MTITKYPKAGLLEFENQGTKLLIRLAEIKSIRYIDGFTYIHDVDGEKITLPCDDVANAEQAYKDLKNIWGTYLKENNVDIANEL